MSLNLLPLRHQVYELKTCEELKIEESIISAIKTKNENSLEHIISTTMVGK